MKNSPQEYADTLVDKYINDFIFIREKQAIQCAIIDVTNTLEAFDVCDCTFVEEDSLKYKKALTILKSKL